MNAPTRASPHLCMTRLRPAQPDDRQLSLTLVTATVSISTRQQLCARQAIREYSLRRLLNLSRRAVQAVPHRDQ